MTGKEIYLQGSELPGLLGLFSVSPQVRTVCHISASGNSGSCTRFQKLFLEPAGPTSAGVESHPPLRYLSLCLIFIFPQKRWASCCLFLLCSNA